MDDSDRIASNPSFVRTGLLGFVGEGGLVFICGTIDGLIQVAGRRHNTEDLIATVMAVEPHGFIYKERSDSASVYTCTLYYTCTVAKQCHNVHVTMLYMYICTLCTCTLYVHVCAIYYTILQYSFF